MVRRFNVMKMKIRFILLVAGIIFALFGCESEPEKDSEVVMSPDIAAQQPEEDLALDFTTLSSSFQKLVKVDSATMRGISWSSSLKDVTDLEDPKTLVEQEEDYYDYLIPLDNKEQADVLYYFNEAGQIQKIELNIYPANDVSRTKLYEEFTTYFNSKYGQPTSEIAEVKIWRNPESNTYIEMRMLGNSKIHDLQIDMKNLSVNENF